jgi:hypothetical protein
VKGIHVESPEHIAHLRRKRVGDYIHGTSFEAWVDKHSKGKKDRADRWPVLAAAHPDDDLPAAVAGSAYRRPDTAGAAALAANALARAWRSGGGFVARIEDDRGF